MTNSYIWNFFKQRGLTDCGISGLMGNLYAESGLNPKNLQNSYEKKLNLNDDTYTTLTDIGLYRKFVKDGAGYGLAQWTYYTRKQNLLNFAKETKRSVGDLDLQLEFLWKELSENFPLVVSTLTSSNDIKTCTKHVLLDFERPADTSETLLNTRVGYAQNYYNMFSNGGNNISTLESVKTSESIVDCKIISPNKTSPRYYAIDTITIHCVVGQWTAQRLGEFFSNSSVGASSNYGVGLDGSIGLYVEESDRAWATGGKDYYGNEIFVNGISGALNDHRAITIEVASDTTHPYAITDAAYEGLIKLLVDICKRYPSINRLRWQGKKELVGNTSLQNMTVHRWFSTKACPGDYIYERLGNIAKEVNRRLDTESNQLSYIEEDEDMDVKRFTELWNEMRKELQDNDGGTWSQEARQWALNTGLIEGGDTKINGEPNYMWEDMLTREQLVTVLYRFAKMMGK